MFHTTDYKLQNFTLDKMSVLNPVLDVMVGFQFQWISCRESPYLVCCNWNRATWSRKHQM